MKLDKRVRYGEQIVKFTKSDVYLNKYPLKILSQKYNIMTNTANNYGNNSLINKIKKLFRCLNPGKVKYQN
jgi:hypothetical protein